MRFSSVNKKIYLGEINFSDFGILLSLFFHLFLFEPVRKGMLSRERAVECKQTCIQSHYLKPCMSSTEVHLLFIINLFCESIP